MVLSQCMQNEKDKKMTEYFKSKNFLEKFLCLMIELNEKERLHMPTWEDQTVLLFDHTNTSYKIGPFEGRK